MDLINPLKLFKKFIQKPATLSKDEVLQIPSISSDELEALRELGATAKGVTEALQSSLQVNYERQAIYKEIDRALTHWMMGGAIELYADYVTTYNPLHNATVWVTASSKTYETELMTMLDRIGIEEKIFDWAYTTGSYGDLIVKVHGLPGSGITHVEDNEHPINISRVDHNGVLLGFYQTPLGYGTPEGPSELLPPWNYVHFRVLGTKKKRPNYMDPTYSEYRTINIMGVDTRRITSEYGTSILLNGIPIYKRLRMAEDSLLFARLTRGIVRYIYKIKVTGSNIAAVKEIINQYTDLLKHARAIDTSDSNPYYDSKANPMSTLEDIIIPVWGETNDLSVEEVGGKADIRWIVDVEELRNQLASALRTPLPLLGGFTEEATGALGSQAYEKLDVRFARTARRLQRALIQGITRLCQIHLAYQNMNPSPNLFQVHMPETSTAEEISIIESLERGVTIVDQVVDMLARHLGDRLDKVSLVDYLNNKFLKLSDFELSDFIKPEKLGETKEEIVENLKKGIISIIESRKRQVRLENQDVKAALPHEDPKWNKNWEANCKDTKIETKAAVVR